MRTQQDTAPVEKAAAPSAVPGLRPFDKAHVLQSLYAAGYILLVFLAMQALRSGLAVASLGASTFIAFSFPHTQSSRARFLIGGYCVGTVAGILCAAVIALLGRTPLPEYGGYVAGCALAVFLSMLLMTGLNFEHPPSAALSIAVATAGDPMGLGVVAIVCIVVLCGIRHLLRGHLQNL